MYLEWYLKEQAAGEKTLEETVVELLAEKRIPYNDGRILYRWDDSQALWSMLQEHREVLNEGYVTYSNEAKERLVRVSHQTLEQFGAVSEQTAREMAEGAAKGQRKQKLH